MELDLELLAGFTPYFTFVSRILLPILAAAILLRCLQSLLRGEYEPEVWAYLSLPNASRVALYHWENIIGRANNADVVLNYPTISRNHLALIRDDKSNWKAIDLASKGGITVNGEEMAGSIPIKKGDVLGLGGVEVALLDLEREELGAQSRSRTKPGRWIRPSMTFWFLTLFQAVLAIQHTLVSENIHVPMAFFALAAMMWGYFFIVRAMGRRGFEAETLAFFLTSVGLSVIASAAPAQLLMTTGFILAGLIFFVVVCGVLRDLRRAKALRWGIAFVGLFFLALVLFAEEVNGARRWIRIGELITIQPSEFVKIAFIFAGAASLDRLFSRRNLFMFIGYTGICIGILALGRDFGSAAVFFTAFLMIAFLRSGDFATIALSLAGLVFAGFFVLTLQPHVIARFDTWGHIWDDPFGRGFQQVRTLSSTASGGLFGLGAGEGTLHRVFAADTDMVFGMVAEELGLIVALICVAAVVILAVFAIRSSSTARSSFYVIAAGAAVTMFLTQLTLNVFGSLDLIPFTGMTFPFLSRGGSSMLASWGLLAFIKAADTRQNASLAVKLDRRAIRRAKGVDWENEEGEGAYDEFDEHDAHDTYDEYDEYDAYDDDDYEADLYVGEPLDEDIDPLYFDHGWEERD
ncbi:MAG: FtsW/RodA/SpoVE family cell cycle protein [Oscillospiraceae bacterium]|nr:FtsW/RodA/SpoVE family cell cycle protein [Oscillospiraceae bacterium]